MFKVNGVYTNRKGTYTVISMNGPKMTVCYEDGQEATLNINVQERIWENIVAERELAEAKANARRKRITTNQHFIKSFSIPAPEEMLFPGWQERVVMVPEPDAQRIKPGDRFIYYAQETGMFFAVVTVTGEAFTANPKVYFYTIDIEKASFFPVDVDASAHRPDAGLHFDSVELDTYPNFRKLKITAEQILSVSEDDFELVAEILTELSEEEGDPIDEDYEEEDEE